MKKKIIATLFCMVLISVSATMGFNIGTHQEKKEVRQEEKKSENKKKEVEKLAIVNMDEGVKYDNQVVNYGTTLMASVSTEHVVTGLEDARSGITTGKYSAYVIIPTTFSNTVESINKQPQQAPIEYVVSQTISNKEREQAIYDVQEVYQKLNSNLTQVYIATILKEFHNTQDAALTVMDNDKKDTSILTAVEGADLKEAIKLPELKRVENTIKPLNLESQYEKNTQVLEKMDGSYEQSLTEAKEKSDHIKEKNLVFEEKNGLLKSVLQGAKEETDQTTVIRYDDTERGKAEDELYSGKKIEIYKLNKERKDQNNGIIDAYTNILNQFHDTVKDNAQKYDYTETKYKELVEVLDIGLADTQQSMEVEEAYVGAGTADAKEIMVIKNQYHYYAVSQMNAIIADANAKNQMAINDNLNNYYQQQGKGKEAIVSFLEQVDAIQLPVEYASWAEYVEAMLPAPEEVTLGEEELLIPPEAKTVSLTIPKDDLVPPSEYPGRIEGIETEEEEIDKAVEEMIGIANGGRSQRNEELTWQTNAFETKVTTMKQKMQGLEDSYQETEIQYKELSKGIIVYDPLAFIKKDELQEQKLMLTQNNNETKTMIGEQNSSYEKYVGDVYTQTSENTTAQVEAIRKGQEASDQKLETGLAEAKISRTKSNELNSVLLYDLTLKLPYTRIGGVENRTAYQVMATPVGLENRSVVAMDSKPIKQEKEIEKETGKERATGLSIRSKEVVIGLVLILVIIFSLAVIFVTKRRKRNHEF